MRITHRFTNTVQKFPSTLQCGSAVWTRCLSNICWGLVGLASAYLQMVLLAGGSHHVPLATRLLGHSVVDATAEAAAHLIVRVLYQVFGQVAGALAPSDHGDHPRVQLCCLWCCGSSGAPRDHEVAWRGAGRVGGEGETRPEGHGGEAASTRAGVVAQPLEGTVGVEVFHGAEDGFVHWGRKVK